MNLYPLVTKCSKHPPDPSSGKQPLAVIDNHPAVLADTKCLDTVGKYRCTGQHVGAVVVLIGHRIDIKKLGARDSVRDEFCLGITAVCRQIPRGVNNTDTRTLELRSEICR